MGLELLGIKVELPRASKRNPHPSYTSANRLATGLAFVRRREVFAHPEPYRYDTEGGPGYFVAGGYPANPRGRNTRWSNSAAAHRAMGGKSGSFHISGGMWSGLSVVQRGRSKAQILFRGRSTGQKIHKRVNKRSCKVRYKTLKVSNALKAWTVLRQARRNILEPTPREMDALRDVVTEGAYGRVTGGLSVEVTRTSSQRMSPLALAIASASRRVRL